MPVEDQTVACRCSMFEHFAALITPSINRVVEFAKRIPGNVSLFISSTGWAVHIASQNAVCLCLESQDVSQGGTNRSNLACTDLLMNHDHTLKQVSLIYVTCQNYQLKKSGSE